MKKNKVTAAVFTSILAFASLAMAGTGEVTGQIHVVRSNDASVSLDWITVQNTTSAGGCTFTSTSSVAGTDGLTPFYVKDDERGNRMLELARTAKTTGATVVIGYDDANLRLPGSSNQCYVRYIDLR